MSPDSKVKNWLSTSLPQSPTENFPQNKKNQKVHFKISFEIKNISLF